MGLPAAVQAQTAQPGHYSPMHDGWYWWMPLHGLLWLLMVAAVVVGVAVLIRYLWSGTASQGPAPGSSAVNHLDERYARGEINRDEYLQRKRDITGR
jgi:putative membrane protein